MKIYWLMTVSIAMIATIRIVNSREQVLLLVGVGISKCQQNLGTSGFTQGIYSFVDKTGTLREIEYTVDSTGFHLNNSSNFTPNTHQIKAATEQHELAEAGLRIFIPTLGEFRKEKDGYKQVFQQINQPLEQQTVEKSTPATRPQAFTSIPEQAFPPLPKLAFPSLPKLAFPSLSASDAFPPSETAFPTDEPNFPVRHQVTAADVQLSDLGETPEVAAARRAHEIAFEQAKALLPVIPESQPDKLPPIRTTYLQDTWEVQQEKLRLAELQRRRSSTESYDNWQ